MAIQKSKTLASGVVGNYWRITRLNIDVDQSTGNITLGLFIDSTHGNDGSKAIFSKVYTFPITLAGLASGSIANAYVNILAKANSVVPNIEGSGTHTFDTDLAGGTIVS